MTKKKLLYIGHAYHKKTKSADFCKKLIAKKYEITDFYFDPYNDNIKTHFQPLQGFTFDVVILWQIMPHMDELKKVIHFKKSVFFPMYDGAPSRDDPIWYEYKDTQIISFCKKLHEELQERGFSSHYIQYFPESMKVENMGDENSVFFWQRINQINARTVETLLHQSNIRHMHIHKALDPEHEFIEPLSDTGWNITYSEWFNTKEEMLKTQQNSAIYIAPRLYEGIGMSFLEAMAMGRCVIAPNNPTMNEYIKNGETGYLYNPQEPQPISLNNIKEIQQNTLKYIEDGYKKWQREKYKILTWIEDKVRINNRLLINYNSQQIEITTYSLFSILPIIRIKQAKQNKKIYFLGIIPIFETEEV